MRGHNICIRWEIRKITLNYLCYTLLSGALGGFLSASSSEPTLCANLIFFMFGAFKSKDGNLQWLFCKIVIECLCSFRQLQVVLYVTWN